MKNESGDYFTTLESLPPEILKSLESLLRQLEQKRSRSPWYKLKESAEYMRCGVTKVRELIDSGLLKSYRLDQKLEKSTILIHKRTWMH